MPTAGDEVTLPIAVERERPITPTRNDVVIALP
jgi:hypothetical protein